MRFKIMFPIINGCSATSMNHLFIERSGKLLYLIYNKTISIMKEYNSRQHYVNAAKFENNNNKKVNEEKTK